MKGMIISMSIIDEYKTIVCKCIESNQWTEAKDLLNKSYVFKELYDEEMCLLNAEICYMLKQKVLALFWTEKSIRINKKCQEAVDFLSFLYGHEIDINNYTFRFDVDYSFLKKRQRIVLISIDYHVFTYMIEMWKNIIELLGHEVFVFNCEEYGKSYEEYELFIKNGKVDWVFSLNNTLLLLDQEGLCGSDFFNAKVNVNYLFDHPSFFQKEMLRMSANTVVTSVDKKHTQFLRRFYSEIKKCETSLLGGEEFEYNKKSFSERSIDVLYVGSLKIRNIDARSEFVEKLTDFIVMNKQYEIHESVEIVFRGLSEEEFMAWFPDMYEQGISPSCASDEIIRKVIGQVYQVDMNINTIFRAGAIASLVNAGIHVDVYGAKSWNDILSDSTIERPECLHYRGVITPKECVEKMCDAKIVLNSMPWFKDATHDRVVNAMLNGAVCVSDPSEYLLERFEDSRDIFYYDLNHLEQLPEIINNILNNPALADEVAQNAYHKSWHSETWQNRVMQMMDCLQDSHYVI